ncbi:hypothetical protein JTE90_002178 [Oedothorax gibbosus]|uniref:Uncharacterized protein n=1 Tax=Oedothorax gibbosus TaxID=931172 RepID=A0AAV6VFS7_9ARAC|nr:hypothetical protein JTE90_002178 [Oedothorax gibbosus]
MSQKKIETITFSRSLEQGAPREAPTQLSPPACDTRHLSLSSSSSCLRPCPCSAMQTQLLASAVLVLLLVQVALAIPPALDRNFPEDYSENALEQLLGRSDKRGCIQRGGGCDARPNDCCPNSACRCNLWGTNCRCDRQGLFQQWGRRK